MDMANSNQKPLATAAMQDLIELTILAKGEPAATKALHEHFEFAIPVLTVDVERDSANPAGKPVILFKLNECLMTHLSALRADKRKDRDIERISSAHVDTPSIGLRTKSYA